MNKEKKECCKKFNPAQWDEKEIEFNSRLFVRDRVRSFFHIPLNFGKVIVRNMEKIEKVDALDKDQMILSDENSLWGADVFIAINKKVPGVKMVKISGTFLTKVFEGPFRDIKEWIEEMKEFVESRDKTSKKLFFFYTTCPKCAKKFGKNYVVILAKV